MPYLSKNDLENYNRDGFLLVKGVFPKSEINELRKKVEAMLDEEGAKGNINTRYAGEYIYLSGDLASKKGLEYLLFDKRIVGIAKEILGPRIVYFGDSSVNIGEGKRSLHRDNGDKTPEGPDWEGDYPLIRFGIYCQDHLRHSGGLKVRKGSHLPADFIEGKDPVEEGRGSLYNIPSEIGDLVFWNVRIVHSGHFIRLKVFNQLCLRPLLEMRVPKFLRVPEERKRIFLAMTYGAPSTKLDRYIAYQINGGGWHEHWKKSRCDKEIEMLAHEAGVEIRKPIPEYGSLYRA